MILTTSASYIEYPLLNSSSSISTAYCDMVGNAVEDRVSIIIKRLINGLYGKK